MINKLTLRRRGAKKKLSGFARNKKTGRVDYIKHWTHV